MLVVGDEPPSYYRPANPIADQSKSKPKIPTLSPTSKDSGINIDTQPSKDFLRKFYFIYSLSFCFLSLC